MVNKQYIPHLVASDIGSTLIQGIQPLPEFTIAVLNGLAKRIPVALITGYNYKTTLNFTKDLDEGIFLLPQNGTLCLKDNKIIWEYIIPESEVKQLSNYLKKNNLPIIVYKGRKGSFKNYYIHCHDIPALSYGFERIPQLSDFEDITGVSTFIPDAIVPKVKVKFQTIVGEKFKVIYSRGSTDSWLEICHTEVRKDLALKRLCDELAIPLADTLYFGDNFNDLEALRLAGHPVLVENAAPELKKEFSNVIQHVNAEGVAHYLNDLYQLGVV